jgi:hypothetical protein
MPEARAIRPFDQVLREINAGRLVDELTDELTEVIAAVRETGKAGELVLSLKLKPRGECNTQLEVVPAVKGKRPERARRVSIFFVNEDNGLQRDDPYQHQFPELRPAGALNTATNTQTETRRHDG